MTKKKEDVADIFFKNYDYTDEEANETSPGGGFYHGKMDKYKSVTDFRNKKRKKKAPKPKHVEALVEMSNQFYKAVHG